MENKSKKGFIKTRRRSKFDNCHSFGLSFTVQCPHTFLVLPNERTWSLVPVLSNNSMTMTGQSLSFVNTSFGLLVCLSFGHDHECFSKTPRPLTGRMANYNGHSAPELPRTVANVKERIDHGESSVI